MSIFLNAILLVAELLLTAGLILFLHRISPRVGLSPLMVLLGALTAAMQFNVLGNLNIQLFDLDFSLYLVSYIVFPCLLLGILVIYILNGTSYARYTLVGIILVTAGIALYQTIPPLEVELTGLEVDFNSPTRLNPRLLLISVSTLAADVTVLVAVYQATSNLRQRFPSRLAAIAALLSAAWVDSILFTILLYAGQPLLPQHLQVHLLGKTISALMLAPMLFVYLGWAASFTDSAAADPRRSLDFFTTAVELEARARYQRSLLQVLSQINQIVVRATDPQALMDQACQLLITSRDYDLAWIGLIEPGSDDIRLAAHSTSETAPSRQFSTPCCDALQSCPLAYAALKSEKPVAIKNISKQREAAGDCQPAVNRGYRSLAAVPMRHAGKVIGVLVVAARKPVKVREDELELLQELCDDLAYALVNLETQQQQSILHSGAQNMQDGLVILDLNGNLVFINPAGAQMVGLSPEEMIGKNAVELSSSEDTRKLIETYRQALLERGQLSAEFERNANGKHLFAAVRASTIYDSHNQPTHLVVTVQDITLRRLYEHQLLTLNRFVNEVVQIHNIQDVMHNLLLALEELLKGNASGIYLIRPDGKIYQTLTHNLPAGYTERIAQNYKGLPGESVLQSLQPVCIENVLEDPVYGEGIHFMADYGVHALAILPVLFRDQIIGALVSYYNKPHIFKEEELQLGLTLAHTLAIAIQNARLYQAEHNQRELAEALVQAAATLNGILDVDEVLDQILEQTLRVANCRSVSVLMLEGDTAHLVRTRGLDGGFRLGQDNTAYNIPLKLPSLYQMYKTEKPILISDTEKDPRWTFLPGTERIKSYAGAPMLIDRQVVGFLNVDDDKPGFFTEETTHRLEAFAAHAANAIRNARLYRQMQEYANELEDRVQERTAELQAAKEYIEGILASVPDAVFVLDEHGRLMHANQAGEALLALARQQNLDLFSPTTLSKMVSGAGPSEKNLLEVKGRAYQPLASHLSQEEQPAGKVLVFRDVTRFRELDKMKTQFVSDVSHELRTPLTNMTIYLDLLKTVNDPAKQQNYLETLQRETGRLAHLIEDLLTISRIEAGRVEMYIKPVDVNRLITELAKDRTIMANSRGLILACDPSSDALAAMADARLLNQAVSNLLTNAINYTPPEGAIMLKSSLVEENGKSWVTISVIDNGVGIPESELNHIFERFYRGSASYQTKAPGTGLGLPISKEIVERMGGQISVESEVEEGSKFTVWLRAML